MWWVGGGFPCAHAYTRVPGDADTTRYYSGEIVARLRGPMISLSNMYYLPED